MLLLDQTLTPAMNVALDDAILETAEASTDYPEILRLWHPESPMVVIGRSSPLRMEVNLDYCHRHGIPVFRRISGGQSIVTDRGCLMYSVLLSYAKRPDLRSLDRAHQFVVGSVRTALAAIGVRTEIKGTCDLVFDNRKFSGNALRCRRNWFLYHGTILVSGFNIDLISECLGTPRRKPDYRGDRTHGEFVTTIPVSAQQVKQALIAQFDASKPFESPPMELAKKLVVEKYEDESWLNKVP